MPVILREGLKQARKKVLTILEKIHGEVRLPHSPQIKDWKIVRLGVRAASSLFLGGWGYVCCSILFFLFTPLPSPRLTINQTHSGYVYSIPDSFTGLKNIITFQLVVWASTTLILLTRGHFVLILVNNFFSGWLAKALAHGQASLTGSLPSKKSCPRLPDGTFFEPCFTYRHEKDSGLV